MRWTSGTERSAPADATGGARRSPAWWAGLDAARGLALIGLMAVQVLPGHHAGDLRAPPVASAGAKRYVPDVNLMTPPSSRTRPGTPRVRTRAAS